MRHGYNICLARRQNYRPELTADPRRGATLALERVDRGECRLSVEARLEVERDADVTGPQRVTTPTDFGPLGLDLLDGVHRETPGAIEPSLIAGEFVELQQGESVAGGAVTQPGTLAERSSSPDQLAGAERERFWEQVAESADDPRGSVTPLHADLRDRFVQRGQPIDHSLLASRHALQQSRDTAAQNIPIRVAAKCVDVCGESM